MDKEEYRIEYIERIKQAYLSKDKFEVKKVSFGGPYETLRRISPNIYNALKKPYFK